jgi:type III secretion protein U
MSGKDTSEEKTLPPSAKKLREARKKGRISHSKEAITAVVTATAFGYLLIRFLPLFAQLSDGLRAVPSLYDQPFSVAVTTLFHRLGADVAVAVAPLVGLLAIVAILGNIVVNGGIVVAIDPILPKIERLDPIAGLKRLLGMKNVIELVKSIFKVGAVSILTCIIISGALQALVEIPTCGLRCAAPIFGALVTPLLLTSVGLFLLLGGLDIGLQRWLFRREMRMTKSEQKRERKESDGDPMIRQHRLRGHRSGSGAKTGLRNATFIVRSADTVLAMRYAVPDAMVPILVARGAQESAFKLLDEAKALNLPVVFDAEAVALIASRLKVGKMITADMFQPIIGCMNEAGII